MTAETNPVIWYLHPYAGAPSLGMSYRPYYLCREFNRHHCKAYIIGASFHHLLTTSIDVEKRCKHETIDSQAYCFVKTPAYKGNLKRILNMLSYAWNIWRCRKEIIAVTGSPTVIIVSSPHMFHYFAARSIAKKYNAKLIFEVRDLWPLSLIELMNLSMRHPFVWVSDKIERFVYKDAHYVVSLLPEAFRYMSQRGLSQERFVHISNGAGTTELLDENQIISKDYKQLIETKKQQGQFIIGYVGAHGIPNSLNDLLEALIILKKEGIRSIHVVSVGNGCQKKKLLQMAKENELDSITFLAPIPKNQVLSLLDQVDAVYLGWKNRPIYRHGVSPNKIFDYMLSGKPILQAFSGAHDLVEQTQSGITVEAENPMAIAKGIKRMATSLTKDELTAMGQKGKETVLSHYTYDHLAKKYMTLFLHGDRIKTF
jgi:glycosyltransferase involved in cell wall biosynthesis